MVKAATSPDVGGQWSHEGSKARVLRRSKLDDTIRKVNAVHAISLLPYMCTRDEAPCLSASLVLYR